MSPPKYNFTSHHTVTIPHDVATVVPLLASPGSIAQVIALSSLAADIEVSSPELIDKITLASSYDTASLPLSSDATATTPQSIERTAFSFSELVPVLGGLTTKQVVIKGHQTWDPAQRCCLYETRTQTSPVVSVRKLRTFDEVEGGTKVEESIEGNCAAWIKWVVEKECRTAHREHMAEYAKLVDDAVKRTVMLTVLGTMLSFAVTLRTSSANDRYNEGRKAWSSITLASRTFAFNVWMHLPPTTLTVAQLAALPADQLEYENAKALIEKRTIINLVQAFSVAAKHYLREENGVYWEDLFHLVSALPRYSFPSSVTEDTGRDNVLGLWRTPGANGRTVIPRARRATDLSASASTGTTRSTGMDSELEKGEDQVEVITLGPAHNPPAPTIYHHFPPLVMFRPMINFFTRKPRNTTRAKQKRLVEEHPEPEANLPLQITLFLSGYLAAVVNRGTLAPSMISLVMAPLAMFQDSITTLERILTTPLPFAYQAHLRFSIYVYLLFLPFQLYNLLTWLAIPATLIVSCIFLGFLELGRQLENPFGYDDSDLELDHFCYLIAQELEEIVRHPQPQPSDWIFSPHNAPFGPDDPRTAQEILDDMFQARDSSWSARRLFHKHVHSHSHHRPEEKLHKHKRKESSGRTVEVVCV
ncbi:Bestrophin/UPF0187 protein [Pseudohyphozyma bogoriensis]|nr:Bestrophin/UPF0187 protein [Pseudohyphozyma bogoriensis]